MRSPIKRSRLKPSKRTAAKRKRRREMDAETREAVFSRDGYRCQKCGSMSSLQWHHVVKRSKSKLLRNDIDNGLTLCAGCHRFWWHADEHAAMNWFIAKYPERNRKLSRLRELPLYVLGTVSTMDGVEC